MREKICCTLTDIFEGFITVLTAPYLYNTSLIKERHGDIVFLHNVKNAVSDSYQVHLCEVIFFGLSVYKNVYKELPHCNKDCKQKWYVEHKM